MAKIEPDKAVLFIPYGYPGSGRTHFANLFSDSVNAAHLSDDRLRQELFDKPTFDKQEDEVIGRLVEYLAEEFLKSGISVIYDTDLPRTGQRRQLKAIAKEHNAACLILWFQIDIESSFLRLSKRDRRKTEERSAKPYDRSQFDDYIKTMQNPRDEEYLVLSGKHTFNTQKSAVVKKLYEMGLISADSASSQVIKPGLVNLVPQLRAGRVDESRRNIVIR